MRLVGRRDHPDLTHHKLLSVLAHLRNLLDLRDLYYRLDLSGLLNLYLLHHLWGRHHRVLLEDLAFLLDRLDLMGPYLLLHLAYPCYPVVHGDRRIPFSLLFQLLLEILSDQVRPLVLYRHMDLVALLDLDHQLYLWVPFHRVHRRCRNRHRYLSGLCNLPCLVGLPVPVYRLFLYLLLDLEGLQALQDHIYLQFLDVLQYRQDPFLLVDPFCHLFLYNLVHLGHLDHLSDQFNHPIRRGHYGLFHLVGHDRVRDRHRQGRYRLHVVNQALR